MLRIDARRSTSTAALLSIGLEILPNVSWLVIFDPTPFVIVFGMTSLRNHPLLTESIFGFGSLRVPALKRWLLAVLATCAIPAGTALAGNVNYGVPTPPGPFVDPLPGPFLPVPRQVPGKEFTTNPNTDFAGAVVPGQSLIWDGLGGTANIHNYSVEVDALANVYDALFKDVIDNNTFMLVSMQGDKLQQSIFAVGSDGTISLWAKNADVKTPPSMGGKSPGSV